jgi:hypothetical protein
VHPLFLFLTFILLLLLLLLLMGESFFPFNVLVVCCFMLLPLRADLG